MDYPQLGVLDGRGFYPYKGHESENFYGSDLYGDRRLSQCLDRLRERVFAKQSLVIHRIADDIDEREAFYRLLHNPKVSVSKLLSDLLSRTQSWERSRHVLLIEDTTYLNYYHLKDRLKDALGLGKISTYHKNLFGYLLHVTMAIDADLGFAVGLADAQLWHNSEEVAEAEKRKRRALPIENKSSYRWIDSANTGAKKLPVASKKTVIADREADIYESFCQWLAADLDFIVRSQSNRNITAAVGKLYPYLDQQPCQGQYEIEVRDKGEKNRVAKIELRYGQVQLIRSHKTNATGIKAYPQSCSLYAISAKEIGQLDQPIHWILLTSHPVDSPQQAKQILHWYQQRWHIEQLFRLLKKQGLQLEMLEYDFGLNILKMGIVALEAAFRILQLNLGIKTTSELPSAPFFSHSQLQLLEILCAKYQGKTAKSRNPYQKNQYQWAAWIIARMGGWKGYNTQARPGPITFARGWKAFGQMFMAFDIFSNEKHIKES